MGYSSFSSTGPIDALMFILCLHVLAGQCGVVGEADAAAGGVSRRPRGGHEGFTILDCWAVLRSQQQHITFLMHAPSAMILLKCCSRCLDMRDRSSHGWRLFPRWTWIWCSARAPQCTARSQTTGPPSSPTSTRQVSAVLVPVSAAPHRPRCCTPHVFEVAGGVCVEHQCTSIHFADDSPVKHLR
jgi:hypothetical protein